MEGKLVLLETILRSAWIAADETWKLQSLGIVFGDALAQRFNLEWVMVEDEYGRDPALKDPLSTILLFPMTSLSKRIEHSEALDVRQLFDEACRTVTRVRAQVRTDRPH
jgi:hypothetical protein